MAPELGRGKGTRLVSRKARSTCPVEGREGVKPKKGGAEVKEAEEALWVQHLCRGVREERLEWEGGKLTVKTQVQRSRHVGKGAT